MREEILRGIVNPLSLRIIVIKLKRSLSTISREIKRNGGYDHYRAAKADQSAWDRALNQRNVSCLVFHHRVEK